MTSSGALDAPFGESGYAELPIGFGAVGEIGVQSSGRTVIALSDYPPSNTLLLGLTSGGGSDATFGDEGTIATGLTGGLVKLLQPGDRILFAGQTGGQRGRRTEDAVVVQLRDADGRSIDAFGEHGAAKVDFEGFSISLRPWPFRPMGRCSLPPCSIPRTTTASSATPPPCSSVS